MRPAKQAIPEPAQTNERIVSIDVLRGFALLGILLINIRSFTSVGAMYMNPEAVGPISGLDHAAWWVTTLLADQKFMAIFSMLFGAGVVLMYERRDTQGLRSAGLHYRRMAGLLVIGLLHAYGVWYGDILVTYALCGLWLFLLRRRGPWLLIGLGVAFLLIGFGINLFFGWSFPHWPGEAQDEIRWMLRPTAEMIADETAAYRGGWLAQSAYRAPAALEIHTFVYLIWDLWRAGGMMLIGMGLLKLGVLRGTASNHIYIGMVSAGFLIGLPLIVTGLLRYPAGARGTADAFFTGSLYNYAGSALLSIGYVGAVMLLCRSSWAPRLSVLAAVGRTALTNYLGQSVICTLIFYGTVHRLGLFGEVGSAAQILVVVGLWGVQMLLSVWWLRRFKMGPVEALWRWASYGRRPAMRYPN